jgi:hypothetical protein
MKNDELMEEGLKDCPECNGNDPECDLCLGAGVVPYTEEDAINDKENECISNNDMMKNGD